MSDQIFPSYRFSVAPMMDRTDRHCRYFYRLMTRSTLLYTEMVTADAIIHGPKERLLGYSDEEHPIALQLGGSTAEKMAKATKIGAEWGYDEVNINCGCPSDRVKSGFFGACLMAEPNLVADCIKAMKDAAPTVDITVKCRIGIDDQDSEAALQHFASVVIDAGSDTLSVHARKAWLNGLSPKENRDIPPLDYGRVYRLKDSFPDTPIIINGGIETWEQTLNHLLHVDGVMIGRAVWDQPMMLMQADKVIFDRDTPISMPQGVVKAYQDYCEGQLSQGVPLNRLVKPIIPFFQSVPGARFWRRFLTIEAVKKGADARILEEALTYVTLEAS